MCKRWLLILLAIVPATLTACAEKAYQLQPLPPSPPRGEAGQQGGPDVVPGAIPPAHLTDSIPGGGPGFGLTKSN
jgi:hypothetical protein